MPRRAEDERGDCGWSRVVEGSVIEEGREAQSMGLAGHCQDLGFCSE